MPARKHGVVWPAEPHTLAKVAILKAYLQAWFPIFGRTKRGQGLLYLDGFAGPGEYSNDPEGSPLAALRAAQQAMDAVGRAWVAGDIHLAFIEASRRRYQHLDELVQQQTQHSRVRVHLIRARFTEGLERLRTQLPGSFGAHPLFVFIDPFGATGAPFPMVANLLGSPCSEVLVNLDADGIGRVLRAGEAAGVERTLAEVFGDASWRDALDGDMPFTETCQQVLALYKARLRSLPNCRYVFSFEMRTSAASLNYYLVFASQHYLGLEKMKGAMRSVDQSGRYVFADTAVGQRPLFREDDPEVYAEQLLKQFRRRRASYDELRDYALNETPFVNPKEMLKVLEGRGRVRVISADPKRKRGTFNEKNLRYIEFVQGEQDGYQDAY